MDRSDEQDQTSAQVESSPTLASPPATTGRGWLVFTRVPSIAALLMFVLLVRPLAAYHVAPLGVVAQPTQTPTATPVATVGAAQAAVYSEYNLMSLAMVSANDVWAVRVDYNQSAQSSQISVFLHFDGTAWARVSPTIHQVGMLSVSVMGSEGWATGSGVMLRLHNGIWAPYAPLPVANT